MTSTLIHMLDLLLWTIMAVSVAYVLIFSLASLLPSNHSNRAAETTGPSDHSDSTAPSFLVLFPAYKEDAVICRSVETFLKQDYPSALFRVAVISDHMLPETNHWLSSQPITLCRPQFEKSSKAKALQEAIRQTGHSAQHQFERVVILDADNIVDSDFLSKLAKYCREGHRAIQCHRTAKNNDSDIAALDGLSEEINNSIFRRGHNRLHLSSALIGSGMCFEYDWFAQHVSLLSTAGEDKELEEMLLKQRVHIKYAEDILVKDEKVATADNFQRQRQRWMTAQVQSLLRMLPYLPKAIVSINVNYIDKTLQQALIPRSMLLVALTAIALLTLLFLPAMSAKWWMLLAALVVALFLAIPARLRQKALLAQAVRVPQLVWRMLQNIFHIEKNNHDFIHTEHTA